VGFGVHFEAKVATELAAFCARYDPQCDGLWLACGDGVVQASIAIDGSNADDDGVHLRWFIASPAVQGTGIGTALIQREITFCDERGYRRVYLWTFQGLDAALHLYRKFDFRLVLQQQGAQWGVEVTEQQFERRSGFEGSPTVTA
jgi:GNAT superfamily N-acetyltransferase